MKLTSAPAITDFQNEPIPSSTSNSIFHKRNGVREALGIGAICASLLTASEARAENAFHADIFWSPIELSVGGIGLGLGWGIIENDGFELGFEIGSHWEIGAYGIDRATFRQMRPVIAGAGSLTAGLSLAFEMNEKWTLELVPHAGIGAPFIIPGDVGSGFRQNGGVKPPFGIVGIEAFFKRKIGPDWEYYCGAAYHGLMGVHEPSVPRGTAPADYAHDVHIIPVGLEYEF